MAITRRSFLAGLGSVSVGLLFRRRLDAVLDSLARDLADEPIVADQAPSAVEIAIRPQVAFRPRRLVVAGAIAPQFVLEDVQIGGVPQLAGPAPAILFDDRRVDSCLHLATAAAGTEIRFRVRYVGDDPRGARFIAALIGECSPGGDPVARVLPTILPIDSGIAIVA